MNRTFFITGTDTGVGKTVFTALLARFLQENSVSVAALKPISSGIRDDARMLREATRGALTLDTINPWHFRAPIAPALAAKKEKKAMAIGPVLAHFRTVRKHFDVVLVEGAGGLLSPLGRDFDSRDLITALRATPIIVVPNRLGAINHILLTLEALPASRRAGTAVVLMQPLTRGLASTSNASLLEQMSVKNVHVLPWFGPAFSIESVLKKPDVQQVLMEVARCLDTIPR